MNYYINVLKKYADFSGRARRKEYWNFTLFHLIFISIAVIIDHIIGTTIVDLPYGIIYFIYCLALLVPSLAVSVRRLHDVGKSGWFYFVALIPIIGWIWIIVLFCTDSIVGENQYGPNPKEALN